MGQFLILEKILIESLLKNLYEYSDILAPQILNVTVITPTVQLWFTALKLLMLRL